MSAPFCIVIVRRNSILVSHGSLTLVILQGHPKWFKKGQIHESSAESSCELSLNQAFCMNILK